MILLQLAQNGSTETNSLGSVVLIGGILLVVLGLLSRKR